MAEITAKMVKELRDKTDAGMMDCKKALAETNGDMEAAVEYLRKSGMAKAEKRADKATKEGKIFAVVEGSRAVMLEILCETDFVASNEKFYDYVKQAASRVLAGTSGDGDVTAAAQAIEADELAALFVKFGEKMVLRRALRYESAGAIGVYLHGLVVYRGFAPDARKPSQYVAHNDILPAGEHHSLGIFRVSICQHGYRLFPFVGRQPRLHCGQVPAQHHRPVGNGDDYHRIGRDAARDDKPQHHRLHTQGLEGKHFQ